MILLVAIADWIDFYINRYLTLYGPSFLLKVISLSRTLKCLFCEVVRLKTAPEEISAILNRYMTLTTPTN